MRTTSKIFIPSLILSSAIFAGCNQQASTNSSEISSTVSTDSVSTSVTLTNTSSLNSASTSANETKDTSASTVKEFQVIAKRFTFEPATLRVKLGDTVRVQITSQDTDHGFAISEFNVNKTIAAGKTEVVEFVANKKGEFTVQCSVFCGVGHPDMKGQLIVE